MKTVKRLIEIVVADDWEKQFCDEDCACLLAGPVCGADNRNLKRSVDRAKRSAACLREELAAAALQRIKEDWSAEHPVEKPIDDFGEE